MHIPLTHKLTLLAGSAEYPADRQTLSLILSLIHRNHSVAPVAVGFPKMDPTTLSFGHELILVSSKEHLAKLLEDDVLRATLNDAGILSSIVQVRVTDRTRWLMFSRGRNVDQYRPSIIRRIVAKELTRNIFCRRVLELSQSGFDTDQSIRVLKTEIQSRKRPTLPMRSASRKTNFFLEVLVSDGKPADSGDFDSYGLSRTHALPC